MENKLLLVERLTSQAGECDQQSVEASQWLISQISYEERQWYIQTFEITNKMVTERKST